jgi:hypothetical protein
MRYLVHLLHRRTRPECGYCLEETPRWRALRENKPPRFPAQTNGQEKVA